MEEKTHEGDEYVKKHRERGGEACMIIKKIDGRSLIIHDWWVCRNVYR